MTLSGSVTVVVFVSAICLAMGGCRVGENERTAREDAKWASAMGGVQSALRARPASGDVHLTPAPIDRSQWQTVAIQSPVDPTYHSPTYTSGWRHARSTRARGDFPTPVSALELDHWSAVAGSEEAATTLLAVAWDVASFVPRAVWFEPPCRCDQSPDAPFVRLRRQGWVAGVLADAPDLPSRPSVGSPLRPGVIRRTAEPGTESGPEASGPSPSGG